MLLDVADGWPFGEGCGRKLKDGMEGVIGGSPWGVIK
jgi:hypothetical protein